MTVELYMYVGEDWTQVISFFDDAEPVPTPPVSPMPLHSPVMDIMQPGFSRVLAELSVAGTGAPGDAADGRLAISGADSNVLTMTLGFADTYRFEGMPTLRFDIFDVIAGRRLAIVKSGIITVDDATTRSYEPV
jgi:hypothetical protein